MPDFTREQFRQVRVARDRAVRACRIGYFRFHSYMNSNSSQHSRMIENALYDTFFFTVRNDRSNINVRQVYARDCNVILRKLHSLKLHSPRYEAQWHAADIDGHDIVYEDHTTDSGQCGPRNFRNEAYSYNGTYDWNDNGYNPGGIDTNIHICPSFFDFTTQRQQVHTIIHELCHTILGFGILEQNRDVYRDDFNLDPFNDLSIAASLRTPDKYAYFILAISGLFSR
ncbi:hypothetical protein [Aquimarina sp. MMG016]|uniref:hypothetical protein n=1 Tax=Aquimarina sp. MMG016 TaxID=2822690 RepID=UPI001B3A0961|nr:hypothetical protein [Aquimarina sp. MMG016]MBQ4819435.1 hypothetical protein [Aquimarina sp. MMG016]